MSAQPTPNSDKHNQNIIWVFTKDREPLMSGLSTTKCVIHVNISILCQHPPIFLTLLSSHTLSGLLRRTWGMINRDRDQGRKRLHISRGISIDPLLKSTLDHYISLRSQWFQERIPRFRNSSITDWPLSILSSVSTPLRWEPAPVLQWPSHSQVVTSQQLAGVNI